MKKKKFIYFIIFLFVFWFMSFEQIYGLKNEMNFEYAKYIVDDIIDFLKEDFVNVSNIDDYFEGRYVEIKGLTNEFIFNKETKENILKLVPFTDSSNLEKVVCNFINDETINGIDKNDIVIIKGYVNEVSNILGSLYLDLENVEIEIKEYKKDDYKDKFRPFKMLKKEHIPSIFFTLKKELENNKEISFDELIKRTNFKIDIPDEATHIKCFLDKDNSNNIEILFFLDNKLISVTIKYNEDLKHLNQDGLIYEWRILNKFIKELPMRKIRVN